MVSTRKLMFRERVWDIRRTNRSTRNSVFSPRSVECTKRNVRHRINCANIFSEISTGIELISAFDSITYKRFNL